MNTNPKRAAVLGMLSVLPFLVMNTIVAKRVEPFFSLLRPDAHTSLLEQVLLFVVLLLLPMAGAFLAVRPMLRKGPPGRRRFYLLNVCVAAILLAGSITVSAVLASEMYRCDVLKVPNCD